MKLDPILMTAAVMVANQEHTHINSKGVRIEPHPQGGVYIVATNGQIMFVAHDRHALAMPGFTGVTLDVQKVGNVVETSDFQQVTCKYIDWRHAVPKEIEAHNAPLAINSLYVRLLNDMAFTLTPDNGVVSIERAAGAEKHPPVLVRFMRDDCFAVVAPLKSNHADSGVPDFYIRQQVGRADRARTIPGMPIDNTPIEVSTMPTGGRMPGC